MRASIAALVVLLAVVAGGCGNPVHLVTGDDQITSYCSALRHDRKDFAAMLAENSPTALMKDVPMLQALTAKAPDDIADDWQVFVTAIEGLRDALRQAGVTPDAYAGGRAPKDLSAADRESIVDAADAVSAQSTVDAAGAIEQQARDVCKVNLGI